MASGFALAGVSIVPAAVRCLLSQEAHGPHAAAACLHAATGQVLSSLPLPPGCMRGGLDTPPDQTRSYSSRCMHALGGGTVGPRGEFLHPTPACLYELRGYVEFGAYDAEVAAVAATAITYFEERAKQRRRASSSREVVVFDIDETALSNRASFFPDSVSSSLPLHGTGQVASQSAGSWQAPQQAESLHPFKNVYSESAPALLPVLGLYSFLHRHGYAVAFLTGRAEASRAATAANLAAAGYGGMCPTPQPDSSGSMRDSVPCYVDLLMRVDGDVRLASVYKPEARGSLVDAGWAIVGNIGDQFSDLVGSCSSPASFKLPNPFYTLL